MELVIRLDECADVVRLDGCALPLQDLLERRHRLRVKWSALGEPARRDGFDRFTVCPAHREFPVATSV